MHRTKNNRSYSKKSNGEKLNLEQGFDDSKTSKKSHSKTKKIHVLSSNNKDEDKNSKIGSNNSRKEDIDADKVEKVDSINKERLLDEMLKGYKEEFKNILLEEEKRGFIIHLIVFIFIVFSLFIILKLIGVTNYIPALYLISGWGLAIFIHFLEAFYWARERISEKEDIAELKFRQELYKKFSK